MTKTASVEIVEMLSKQEKTIAGLYSAFRKALPEMDKFWSNLIREEDAHAAVLGELVKMCSSSNVYLDETKFNVVAIRTNIENMERETEKVSTEGITAIRALALASGIENSLIEQGYFRIVQSTLPEVKRELDALEQHTKKHVSMVDEMLKRAKADTDQVMEL